MINIETTQLKTITTTPSNMTFKDKRIYLTLNENEYKIITVRVSQELMRLEINGKGIDEDIKVERKEGNLPYGDVDAFHKYAYNRVKMPKRELRFVVEGNTIKDIASKQHNTYSEKKMEKYINSNYKVIKLKDTYLENDIMIFVREKDGIKYFVQIYPGNIITTQAMQVCSCYKIYGFYISSFRNKLNYTKVKRVAVLRAMEEVMSKAIDDKIKELKENDMPKNKIQLSEETAKKLLSCIFSTQQIMDSTIKEILDNFKSRPKTTFDLAISCATTATTSKTLTKFNSKQKISTAGDKILNIESKEGIKSLMEEK